MINNSIDQPMIELLPYIEENGSYDKAKMLFIQQLLFEQKKDYPISQYNLIIDLYNKVDDNEILITLPESKEYRYVYQFWNKPLGMVLYLFQAFIPLINLLFFYLLIISFIKLKKIKKIVKINSEQVKNPMELMMDQDELCKTLGREYLLEIDHDKNGIKVYYSNQLKDYWTGLEKKDLKVLGFILIQFIIIGASAVLLSLYFTNNQSATVMQKSL